MGLLEENIHRQERIKVFKSPYVEDTSQIVDSLYFKRKIC